MSDNMSLVQHVNRSKNGLTKMQITVSISTRAGMAELSKRLGISQLAIVRSALAAYLLANNAGAPNEAQYPASSPTETAPSPAPEAPEAPAEAPAPTPEAPMEAPVKATKARRAGPDRGRQSRANKKA
jgi:hypothetical protein